MISIINPRKARILSVAASGLLAVSLAAGTITAPAAVADQSNQTASHHGAPSISLTTPPHALAQYPFGLRGKVSEISVRGKTVVLQRRQNGAWKTIDTRKLQSRTYLFQQRFTARQLGMKYYRVLLRGQAGVIDRSRTHGVHVHKLDRLGELTTPRSSRGAGDTAEAQQVPEALAPPAVASDGSGNHWVEVDGELLGAIKCTSQELHIDAGPSWVNTTGFAFWVAKIAYYDPHYEDWFWYPQNPLTFQYNQNVNAQGGAVAGWRTLATGEVSGFASAYGFQPGTYVAVYNYAADYNGNLVSGGWSYNYGVRTAGTYCQV